jgi:hypothetical protein
VTRPSASAEIRGRMADGKQDLKAVAGRGLSRSLLRRAPSPSKTGEVIEALRGLERTPPP